MQIVFEVGNTWTRMPKCEHHFRWVLDQEFRYPTQVAALMAIPGMAESGEFGAWDGWVRLLRQPKTIPAYFPTGLLERAQQLADKWQYRYLVNDKRIRPEPGFPEIGDGLIPLRDYQTEAVERGVELGRGVFDIPPRGGKTRLMVELHRRIALPTLWVAPTDRIVTQTVQVLESFYGKNYAYQLVGTASEPEAMRHQVVVCTIATASNLSTAFFESRQMLVIDEWHHSSAKSYRYVIKACDHVYYRYGMTGTHYRSGSDGLEMHGLISQTIYRVTSQQLLELGVLVPTRVVFLPVLSKRLSKIPGKTFNTGHGKLGIHEHKERNQMVAHAAYALHKLGRKVLVLVGTKKQGRLIQKMLTLLMPRPSNAEFEAAEFLSTDVDRGRQGRALTAFLESEEINILIGTSLLGEGVDLPNADALVYARGEQAKVTHTQNAYRVCTAGPGKRDAIIVDFADRHNAKLKKHSHTRLDAYLDDPIFRVDVLSDPSQLAQWAQQQRG
jgi:superfamily II DNA or RNA helicase